MNETYRHLTIDVADPEKQTFMRYKLGNKGVYKIGALYSSNLTLGKDRGVARMHAVIEQKDDELVLIDLGATAGSVYRGEKIKREAIIPSGALVQFGQYETRVWFSDDKRMPEDAAGSFSEATRIVHDPRPKGWSLENPPTWADVLSEGKDDSTEAVVTDTTEGGGASGGSLKIPVGNHSAPAKGVAIEVRMGQRVALGGRPKEPAPPVDIRDVLAAIKRVSAIFAAEGYDVSCKDDPVQTLINMAREFKELSQALDDRDRLVRNLEVDFELARSLAENYRDLYVGELTDPRERALHELAWERK